MTGDGISDAGIIDEGAGLLGLATLDVDEAVGPANDAGEQRECLLEIAVKADEGFEDVGGERRAGGGAGGDFDTVCLGSDGDVLGAFFGAELKIKLVGLLGIEGDAFGESFKAREADGDFTFAWENAPKGVLAEIIRDSRDFFVAGQILERDFRVGPNSLDLIRANRKDRAGEFCRFGRGSSSCDGRKCQE